MNTTEAYNLAIKLMDQFGLIEQGWRFNWMDGQRTFGECWYGRKLITLSWPMTILNNQEQVEDTIRHEIAHALVGRGHGHDKTWQAMCRSVGAKPERCYKDSDVIQPEAKYLLVCEHCGNSFKRYRKRSKMKHACRTCCNAHSGGQYDQRFLMTWKENK